MEEENKETRTLTNSFEVRRANHYTIFSFCLFRYRESNPDLPRERRIYFLLYYSGC
jgi:hypothetical protein